MLSVIIMVSFITILGITYFNIQNQNKLRMENISASTLRYMEMSEKSMIVGKVQTSGENLQGFGILVNGNGEMKVDTSFGAFSRAELSKVITNVIEKNITSGELILLGQKYEYSASVVGLTVNMNETRFDEIPITEKLYQITFLNVTDSHKTLMQLLITFVIIGAATLVGVLGTSVYFAKQAVKPIEQSYEKQQQFIQDASHELKTPLSSIRSNLDVLYANPYERVKEQEKWLGFISDEIQRMSRLVGDLLYLAKCEYGQNTLTKTPVDMSKLIDDVTTFVEAIAFEKNVRIIGEITPNIFIQGDEDKVLQVIKILFDNAIKYTDTGGWVKAHLMQNKHQIVFQIINTGAGISHEHIDHIFDRFYRADASRKHDGGYGLGLSIAKSILESMDATIDVESTPKEKTTFAVKFKR